MANVRHRLMREGAGRCNDPVSKILIGWSSAKCRTQLSILSLLSGHPFGLGAVLSAGRLVQPDFWTYNIYIYIYIHTRLVTPVRSSSPHSSRRSAVLLSRFEVGRAWRFSHVLPGHGHFCRSRTELEESNSVLSHPLCMCLWRVRSKQVSIWQVLHPHVLTTLAFDRSVLRKFRKGTSVFAFTTFAGAGHVAAVSTTVCITSELEMLVWRFPFEFFDGLCRPGPLRAHGHLPEDTDARQQNCSMHAAELLQSQQSAFAFALCVSRGEIPHLTNCTVCLPFSITSRASGVAKLWPRLRKVLVDEIDAQEAVFGQHYGLNRFPPKHHRPAQKQCTNRRTGGCISGHI